MIGTLVCADECTSKQMRITFARLMVEVDVTKPLVRQVLVDIGAGLVKEQKVIFERLLFVRNVRWVIIVMPNLRGRGKMLSLLHLMLISCCK